MNDDDARLREMHDDRRDELYRREFSNQQLFDKAILTLSNAGLVVSLAVVKDLITENTVIHLRLLLISVGSFILVNLVTLISFLIAKKANTKELPINFDYYIRKNKQAKNTNNRWDQFLLPLSVTSLVLYIVAVVFMGIFIYTNFSDILQSTKTK